MNLAFVIPPFRRDRPLRVDRRRPVGRFADAAIVPVLADGGGHAGERRGPRRADGACDPGGGAGGSAFVNGAVPDESVVPTRSAGGWNGASAGGWWARSRPPRRLRLARARPAERVRAAVAGLLLWLAAGAAQAQTFTDAELIDGFIQTVFGAESDLGAAQNEGARQIKKFTGPVRYHMVSTSKVERRPTLRGFLTILSGLVDNLELVETDDVASADMLIFLSDRKDYAATIRKTVWDGVDSAFLEQNACSAVIASRRSGIERANIYLVADEAFDGLSHCMVEEIAQSLGPANDSTNLENSIFNDESDLNDFGLFDWFILNMLYDERIRPGMREAQVLPLLPDVIADVRKRLPDAAAGLAEQAHRFAHQR